MVSKIKKIAQDSEQWQFMLFIILLNFLSSFIFSTLAELFYSSLGEGFNRNYSFNEKIVLFVIIAPILETLIFQYAIIEICKRIKMALKYCCLVSALAFAIFHLYNIFYFLYAFIAGLMFAYLYIKGKNIRNAILYSLIGHVIYNGIVLIIDCYS